MWVVGQRSVGSGGGCGGHGGGHGGHRRGRGVVRKTGLWLPRHDDVIG